MILLLLLLSGSVSYADTPPAQNMVVIVPVADVWSRPLAPGEKPTDDLRETQVLFGEQVLIHESSGSWVRIEAVEQPTFRQHNKWEGYPGWISGDAVIASTAPNNPDYIVSTNWLGVKRVSGMNLGERGFLTRIPLGSYVKLASERMSPTPPPMRGFLKIDLLNNQQGWVYSGGIKKQSSAPVGAREMILATSTMLMGDPYVWGGLTPANLPSQQVDGMKHGVDCSGLVHLAYRVNGLTIPRDSHEQWMKAKPIKRAELKPADLIFSAKADNPKKITHVALYAGDGQIIEAPQTGMVVRKISFKEKYGKDLKDVESGDTVGERVIYFGSYLQ